MSEVNVWNHWIGNENSGMDAVVQANGFDKTQLSNGHRKHQKNRTSRNKPSWNLIHGTDEDSQLNIIETTEIVYIFSQTPFL